MKSKATSVQTKWICLLITMALSLKTKKISTRWDAGSSEVKAPAARAELGGEVKLNASSGSSIEQANLLVSEGSLHNDAFKAYKIYFNRENWMWQGECEIELNCKKIIMYFYLIIFLIAPTDTNSWIPFFSFCVQCECIKWR